MEGGGAGGGGGVSIATTYRPGYVSVPDSTIRAASAAAHSHRLVTEICVGLHYHHNHEMHVLCENDVSWGFSFEHKYSKSKMK